MKKNLTRLCCLVLALVMALFMAACGKSGDAPAELQQEIRDLRVR